jgi:hypothetical protein
MCGNIQRVKIVIDDRIIEQVTEFKYLNNNPWRNNPWGSRPTERPPPVSEASANFDG